MNHDLPIIIREHTPDDRNFILDSWHRSDKSGGHWSVMDQSAYMHKIKRTYERVLDKSQVLIACLEDINWQIFGYCVAQPQSDTLWWLFVKSPYRRLGLGQSLLMASLPKLFAGEDISAGCHTVRMAKYIRSLESRCEGIGSIRYNPQHILKMMR